MFRALLAVSNTVLKLQDVKSTSLVQKQQAVHEETATDRLRENKFGRSQAWKHLEGKKVFYNLLLTLIFI